MDAYNLTARLALDTSEYDEALGRVRSDLPALRENVEETEKKVGGMGDKLGAAFKAIGLAIGAATTAIGAFAKESVSVGQNFDKSISQVAATMGTTVDEIQELRDFAQEMGATTAFSATQAADALNYMALAGYDAQTSMQMLPNVLNLAASGGIDLAYASDMITDSQSALGLSLDETAELVDKMAQAASKSNTSVAQLGEAILQVGGTAKNLSGGTTELSTVLGILADNGIKGAEGGTALRNILNSLTAPTDKASDLMRKMGVSVFDAEGNMRSLNDVFGDLQASMSSMTQQERMNVISTIFNARDMKSAEALLANVGDRYAELSGYIDNAAGSAQKMADVQLDNLAGNITLFKSALEGAQIAISDELTPTLNEFVKIGAEGLQDITNAFKETGFEGAIDALSDTLDKGINKIFEALPDAVGVGAQIVKILSDGIILNAPVLIESAKDLAVSLIDSFATNADEQIGIVVDVVSEIADTLTDPATLSEITGAGLDLLVSLADGIGDAIPELVDTAADIIINITEYLTDAENIGKLANAAIDITVALGNGIINAIPRVVSAVIDLTDKIIEQIFAQDWESTGSEIDDKLASGLQDHSETVITAFSNTFAELDAVFGTHLQRWYDETARFWEGFGSYLYDTSHADQAVNDAVSMQVSELRSSIIQAANEYARAGTEATEAFNKAISDNVNAGNMDLFNQYLRDEFDADYIYQWSADLQKGMREASGAIDYYTEHYKQKDLAGGAVAALPLEKIESENDAVVKSAVETYTNEVSAAVEETAEQLEEKSKDFETKAIGEYTNLGVKQVLGHSLSDAEKEADRIASTVYSASKNYVERITKQQGLSTEEQLKEWETIRGQFIEGSQQWIDASDKIFDLQQKQRDEAEKQRAADEKAAEEASKKADAEIKEKYNNSVEEIRRRTKLEELSLSQQIELWENLQKEYDEGSEYYNKIEEKLFDLNKAQEAENLKEQEEAAKKAAATIKDIYDKGIEDIRLATKYNDLSYDEQIALWEELLKQFEEGSDYYNKIVEKIFDLNEARKKEETAAAAQEAAEEEKREKERTAALQKQYNERLKLIAEYDEQIDALNKANEAAQKSYDDALESRTKAIEQSYKLFDKAPERTLYSGIDLRTNLEGQVNNIKEFYSNLDTLTARGVGDELIAELRSMGVGALDQVEALVALSDDELSKYTAVYDEKAALSKAIAEEELSGLKAETEDIINKNLDDIEDLTKKRSEEIGLSVVEGIALGISENANLIIGALDGAFAATKEVGVATKSMSPSEKSSKFGSTNNNNITVNINGGEYNDIEKLATEVGDVIEFRLARLQAGYSATEMDMA